MISTPTENERAVTGMDEYIERKALREAFENADADVVEEYEDGTCDWGFGHKNIMEVINSVPAADVATVRHGDWMEWFPGDCALIMTGEEMLYRCSCCDVKYSDAEGYKYCPNCGARMDLGEA